MLFLRLYKGTICQLSLIEPWQVEDFSTIFTQTDADVINECISQCLRWLHAVCTREAWHFSSHSSDEIRNLQEKNWTASIATKHQSSMGLSHSPAKQSCIKLIIWARVLKGLQAKDTCCFHKVRRLSAMQYNTEHNLQSSLHTEGHVSLARAML